MWKLKWYFTAIVIMDGCHTPLTFLLPSLPGQALFLEQASSVESLSTIASLQTHCQMEAGHNSSGVPESMNTESSSLNDGSQYLKCEGNLRIDGSCPRTFGANSDDTNCESAEDDHPELSNSTLQSSVKVEVS